MKQNLKMNSKRKKQLRDLLTGVDGELFHHTLSFGKEDHLDFMIELYIQERILNHRIGISQESSHELI